MYRCPRCKNADGYTVGERCIHCSYVERDVGLIQASRRPLITVRDLLRCRRCKSPDGYEPGQKCLHCGHTETDEYILEQAREARMNVGRSALLRCRRCKSPDTTPGEKCIHCGYVERDPILIKLASKLKYRIIPLMKQRDFLPRLEFRGMRRFSIDKYMPVAGALLEYEYAYALLFSDRVLENHALQNLYRVVCALTVALRELLEGGSNINDNNMALLREVKEQTARQYQTIKDEFDGHNWSLAKRNLVNAYPPYVRAAKYFEGATMVGDLTSALNGLTSVGFKGANWIWELTESTMETVGDVTGIGSAVMAPFSVAENVTRGRRDERLRARFDETSRDESLTILDRPAREQQQMIRDAHDPRMSSAQFAGKWGGKINYQNVKAWADAAETHRQGSKRRRNRAIASAVGGALTVAALVVTCGTAAVVLTAGAAVITVAKLADSANARRNKSNAKSRREQAAEEIVNSAVRAESNAIHLLVGLSIISDGKHAQYLNFSDVYGRAVEDVKGYLDPA